jgi:hypothetical protein
LAVTEVSATAAARASMFFICFFGLGLGTIDRNFLYRLATLESDSDSVNRRNVFNLNFSRLSPVTIPSVAADYSNHRAKRGAAF